MNAPTSLDIARDAWGKDIPDWIVVLAEACGESSQNKVAQKLNRSASLVSGVLRNTYRGNMEAVEDVVRGVFMASAIACPAMGEISTAACRDWMRLAHSFSNENSQRVRMYRACRSCPRFKGASK